MGVRYRRGGSAGELLLCLLVLAGVWFVPMGEKLAADTDLVPLSGSGYLYTLAGGYLSRGVKIWLSLALILVNAFILRGQLLRYFPGLTKSYLPVLLCPLLSFGGAYMEYDVLPPVLALTLLLWVSLLCLEPMHESALQDRIFRIGLLFSLLLLIYPGALLLLFLVPVIMVMNRKCSLTYCLVYLLGLLLPIGGAWALLEWQGLQGEALIPNWPLESLGRLSDHMEKGVHNLLLLFLLLGLYLMAIVINTRDPYSRKAKTQRALHLCRLSVFLLLVPLGLLPYPSGITVLLGSIVGVALTVYFVRVRKRAWLNLLLLLLLLFGGAYSYYL